MMVSGQTTLVRTHDGGNMPAHVELPESGRGPGLVMLQEIFGVTDYLKSRARDLADLGYLVLVPELYWRLGQDVVLDEHSQEGLQQAFGYMQQLDEALAVDDSVATLEHIRALPETGGRAGALGFCLGGRLAYHVAVQSDPDVLVSYYGSGIADQLQGAAQVRCATLFHFGEADSYIPGEQVERIRQAFADHPHTELRTHPGGGHAFDNRNAPMFYNQHASEEAWPQTVAFLRTQFRP